MSQKEDPWSDDAFGRKSAARVLTRVLERSTTLRVVSVTAPYGMGKTYFAERLYQDHVAAGKAAVFINAWKEDFGTSPILAVMSALRTATNSVSAKTKRAALKRNFTRATKALAKAAPRIGLRIATAALAGVDSEVLREGLSSIAKEGERELEKALSQHEAYADSVQAFKEALQKWSSTFGTGRADQSNRFYVFVDELDRCRPDYAIRFLEDLKHFFDIPAFTFVLFVDTAQLTATAAQLYGPRASGEPYIAKFVDWMFRLPDPSVESLVTFVLGRLGEFQHSNDEAERSLAARVFAELSTILHVTLREATRIVSDVRASLILYGNEIDDIPMLCLVSVLHFRNFDVTETISDIATNSSIQTASGTIKVLRFGPTHTIALSATRTERDIRALMKKTDFPRNLSEGDREHNTQVMGALKRINRRPKKDYVDRLPDGTVFQVSEPVRGSELVLKYVKYVQKALDYQDAAGFG